MVREVDVQKVANVKGDLDNLPTVVSIAYSSTNACTYSISEYAQIGRSVLAVVTSFVIEAYPSLRTSPRSRTTFVRQASSRR